MDLKQGEFAVKFARRVIEAWVAEGKELGKPEKTPKDFLVKSGVFTTLYTYPERDLRGCIGLPYPHKPLIDALIEAAISATQDSRFIGLGKGELGKIIIEVSILTPPEKITASRPEDYPMEIKIGRDGLIIKKGMHSGLLLPQVPVEYGWDVKTFLEHLCNKAFLPSDAWLSRDAEIYSFRSEIFGEKKPRGRIEKM